MLEVFGAELILTPGEEGSNGAVRRAQELAAAHPEWCFLYQYGNDANPRAHYEGTGPEILRDCPEITHFVAGLGTSGTLMGTGRYLKEQNADVKVIAIEPPLGERVEGLRNLEDGYIPPVFDQWYGFDDARPQAGRAAARVARVDPPPGQGVRRVRRHLERRGAGRRGQGRRRDRRGHDRLHRLRRRLEVPLAPAPTPTTSTRPSATPRRSSTSETPCRRRQNVRRLTDRAQAFTRSADDNPMSPTSRPAAPAGSLDGSPVTGRVAPFRGRKRAEVTRVRVLRLSVVAALAATDRPASVPLASDARPAAAPRGASSYTAVNPARLADTRAGEPGSDGFERARREHDPRPGHRSCGHPDRRHRRGAEHHERQRSGGCASSRRIPAGIPRPTASSLNVDKPGRIIANLATVQLSHGRRRRSLREPADGPRRRRRRRVRPGRRCRSRRAGSSPSPAAPAACSTPVTAAAPVAARRHQARVARQPRRARRRDRRRRSTSPPSRRSPASGPRTRSACERPLASSLNIDLVGQTRNAQGIVALSPGERVASRCSACRAATWSSTSSAGSPARSRRSRPTDCSSRRARSGCATPATTTRSRRGAARRSSSPPAPSSPASTGQVARRRDEHRDRRAAQRRLRHGVPGRRRPAARGEPQRHGARPDHLQPRDRAGRLTPWRRRCSRSPART